MTRYRLIEVANLFFCFYAMSNILAMTNLKTTTKAEWDILKTSDAPWADFESEFFMQNVPTSWIKNYDYNHFLTLMEGRDAAAKGNNFYKQMEILSFSYCFKIHSYMFLSSMNY